MNKTKATFTKHPSYNSRAPRRLQVLRDHYNNNDIKRLHANCLQMYSL
jgi:hypothetical protein